MNHNLYLSEALWLYCGQEMRVWLPLREKSQSSVHTFISNRIMLGFPVSIYPLSKFPKTNYLCSRACDAL